MSQRAHASRRQTRRVSSNARKRIASFLRVPKLLQEKTALGTVCAPPSVFCVLLVAATTCVGCRRCDATNQNKTNQTGAVSSNAVEVPRALEPLRAANRVEPITVPGRPDATLLVPLGVTTAKPIVVVLLPGSGGIGEQCEQLGQSIAANAFVFCQSIRLEGQSSTPFPWNDIEAALRASVRNVRDKYGAYVQSKELTMVGVGESAAESAVPIVRSAPEFFTRVALLDGGFKVWSNVDSARFAAAGAKAFLARCMQPSCRADAKRVVVTLKNAGTATRLDLDPSLEGVAGSVQPPPPTHELIRWLLTTG